MHAALLVVWLGLFFVAARAQTGEPNSTHCAEVVRRKVCSTPSLPADVMFSQTEYAVDEEGGQLGISLRAELEELVPTEDVVVTIALAASQGNENSATPFGIGGSG